MQDDRVQIGDVLIRYATGIDSRDWRLFRNCWPADVDADYGDVGHFTGVDAITDAMIAMHQNMGPTYHRMTNFAIDLDGDRANVRSYVHAVIMVRPNDSTNWVDAAWHYDDVFVRTADGWRISRRTFHVGRVLSGGELATSSASQANSQRS
jgi:3-phenylpropionate/cinnamic acid dioxygenase small subunit